MHLSKVLLLPQTISVLSPLYTGSQLSSTLITVLKSFSHGLTV